MMMMMMMMSWLSLKLLKADFCQSVSLSAAQRCCHLANGDK